MSQIEIEENEQDFLLTLFKETKGDLSAQASMYDMGASMGMDKEASRRTAEGLLGWELAEIRTLSGGIGITELGVEEALKLGAEQFYPGGPVLGNAPVIDDAMRQRVEQVVMSMKNLTGNLGLKFDPLTEMVADIKTIDAQLTSSKPKTAIIRECFRSVRAILEKVGAKDSVAQVVELLGE